MTALITPREIFQKDQVLTLEVAKKLIGKRIAVTNPEYKGNSTTARVFTLEGIETEWDLAAKDTDMAGYANRQEYWATMDERSIKGFKNRQKLVFGESEVYYNDGESVKYPDGSLFNGGTCEEDNWNFSEPTFYGSDADRELYYVVLNHYDQIQVTKKICNCTATLTYSKVGNEKVMKVNDLEEAVLFCKRHDIIHKMFNIDGEFVTVALEKADISIENWDTNFYEGSNLPTNIWK